MTTTELLASEIIAPLVARLRTDAPGTKFELATGDRRLDLRSGEADLAIRLVEPTPEPDLVGRRVGTSRWASYCSRDDAERSGLPSMTEDLGSHRLIAGSGALENSAAHLWFRNIAGKAEIAMRCNTVANLSAAVRSGNGIGP